jgi:phospholipid/cholesterol/gamma-HCH transport system substrate-binding protein
MKKPLLALLAAATVVCVSGCGNYRGLNSLPLPGDIGTGGSSYQIKVQVDNAASLVPNTPVLINDINVGTVTNVGLDGWTPTLTVSLLPSVHLPANTVAKLGLTSLLGSKHLELSAPDGVPAEGTLAPGAVITEDRTHHYPETEDLLASVSLLLNGGGLQHFQTIATELNTAFGGRENDVRDLLTQLDTFTGGLDAQRNDIIGALHGLDKFGGALAPRMNAIDAALQNIPRGVGNVNDNWGDLRDAIVHAGKATEGTANLSENTADRLKHVASDLEPVLRHVADTQSGSMMKFLKLAPFVIFPLDSIPYDFRGDYVHIILTVDLTNEALDQAYLGGTPLAGLPTAGTKLLQGKLPKQLPPGLQAIDPLRPPTDGNGGPLHGMLGSKNDTRSSSGVLHGGLPGFGG